MPRPGLKPLLKVLLAGLLLLSLQAPAAALPGWMNRNPKTADVLRVSPPSSGQLQEVAPPGAVQEIKRHLSDRRPQLHLLSPRDDSTNSSSSLNLTLGVEDWPVSRDPELGLGPHVALQVDERPLIRIDALENGRAHVQLDDLSPGSHRFAAWAAYPWGEAVQSSGASMEWRLHQWQPAEGTQPRRDSPWLTPNPVAEELSHQPLLLDWLLWNAPLQNLRDGDARWRVRVSLDGDSFLVDHQDALWLKGTSGNNGTTLQLELLDGRGEPLQPVFNNRLIRLQPARGAKPVWLKERISTEEVLRLSGEPTPMPQEEDISEAAAVPAESVPEPAPAASSNQSPDLAKPSEGESQSDPELMPLEEERVPETQVVEEQPTQPQPVEAQPETAPSKPSDDKPVLRPESSLGGSARELLDAEGRLRQP